MKGTKVKLSIKANRTDTTERGLWPELAQCCPLTRSTQGKKSTSWITQIVHQIVTSREGERVAKEFHKLLCSHTHRKTKKKAKRVRKLRRQGMMFTFQICPQVSLALSSVLSCRPSLFLPHHLLSTIFLFTTFFLYRKLCWLHSNTHTVHLLNDKREESRDEQRTC